MCVHTPVCVTALSRLALGQPLMVDPMPGEMSTLQLGVQECVVLWSPGQVCLEAWRDSHELASAIQGACPMGWVLHAFLEAWWVLAYPGLVCSWGSGLQPKFGQVHESVLCLVFYLELGWRRTASGIRAELTWFEGTLAFSQCRPGWQLGADEQDPPSGRSDPTSFSQYPADFLCFDF